MTNITDNFGNLVGDHLVCESSNLKLVPLVPTEEMYSGLARNIMTAFDLGCRTLSELLKHLGRIEGKIPDWMFEGEMEALHKTISKDTRCYLIYRAMVEGAPVVIPAVVSEDRKHPDGWSDALHEVAKEHKVVLDPTWDEVRDYRPDMAKWVNHQSYIRVTAKELHAIWNPEHDGHLLANSEQSVVFIEGSDKPITTRPLKAGVKVNLLAISQTQELIDSGAVSVGDQVDPSVRLKTLYLSKKGHEETGPFFKISHTDDLAASQFVFSANHEFKTLELHYGRPSALLIDGQFKTVDVYVDGELNLETGDLEMKFEALPTEDNLVVAGYNLSARRVTFEPVLHNESKPALIEPRYVRLTDSEIVEFIPYYQEISAHHFVDAIPVKHVMNAVGGVVPTKPLKANSKTNLLGLASVGVIREPYEMALEQPIRLKAIDVLADTGEVSRYQVSGEFIQDPVGNYRTLTLDHVFEIPGSDKLFVQAKGLIGLELGNAEVYFKIVDDAGQVIKTHLVLGYELDAQVRVTELNRE
jgi:hypothetical protein